MGDFIPWPSGWREEAWSRLSEAWDIVVIGGGITGAGIFSAAAHIGMRVLLLEQNDFASGTSSRSSKLVHGGLRYLKQGNIGLTRRSVRERQQLLASAAGLVNPLPFLYTIYERDRVKPWMVSLGLALYTHLASGAGAYQRLRRSELLDVDPPLDTRKLVTAFRYQDAQTDDSRLVFRVISDGLRAGQGRAVALNYVKVTSFSQRNGRVRAAEVTDLESERQQEAPGRVLVNATGIWADATRRNLEARPLLRPLRGSHLVFDLSTLPLREAFAFLHPEDARPVFAYPWEGVALVGTTDVDHDLPLSREPSISADEAEYLLDAVRSIFRECDLQRSTVVSAQAGIRPVLDTGKADPSAESREHLSIAERGLLTVVGGKLTTFRLVAIDALRAAHALDSALPDPKRDTPVLDVPHVDAEVEALDQITRDRLPGRYGLIPSHLLEGDPEALQPIEGTPYHWGELTWSSHAEGVVHLSDLLLRRFRLGLLCRDGGCGLLSRLRQPVSTALGWNERTWDREVKRFGQELREAHGLPEGWRSRD